MEINNHLKQHNTARPALTKPISLRLTQEEYQQLKADAGDSSISEYIRKALFRPLCEPATKAATDFELRLTPQSRQKILAQILVHLGQLKAANEVSEMLAAIKLGLVDASPEFSTSVNTLHAEIQCLRLELLKALGLRPSQSKNK